MRARHLEHLVIRPTLIKLAKFNDKLYSDAAVQLLLGTAAQESDCGYFLHQMNGGPAKGIYQIEPATQKDIVGRYLMREENQKLREIIIGFTSRDAAITDPDELITNLRYATAIARIRYWMNPNPLPDPGDLVALAEYWDDVYNANPDHGTPAEWLDSWKRFINNEQTIE